MNGLEEKCTSLITRQRSTTVGDEKNIIDFVVVSQNLVKHIKSMFIEDKRKHVLTSLRKNKNGINKNESDHNTIVTELDISYKQEIRSSRIEMLNLKDKEAQKIFLHETNVTTQLLEIIDREHDIEKGTKKLLKRLKGLICQH